MARIRQQKLGQWSGLLEEFITEWLAPESDRHSGNKGRRRQAAVMGRHGAP
jgi:hypothetical protein